MTIGSFGLVGSARHTAAASAGEVLALYQMDTDVADSSNYNRVLTAYGNYSFYNGRFKCDTAGVWFLVPFGTELRGKSYTLEFQMTEYFNWNAGNYYLQLGGGIFDIRRTYVNSSTCSITASISAWASESQYVGQDSYTRNWNTMTNLFVRFAYDHITGTYRLYYNGSLVWSTSNAILSSGWGEVVTALTFPSNTSLTFEASNAGAMLDCLRVSTVALGAGMPDLPLSTSL